MRIESQTHLRADPGIERNLQIDNSNSHIGSYPNTLCSPHSQHPAFNIVQIGC